MRIFILVLLLALSIDAQGDALKFSHELSSKILNENVRVTVKLPASYQANQHKSYPVFYMLDDGFNTDLVDSMIKRLHISNGANEHIVVGVNTTNRLRDFAPTINLDPRGPVGEGGGADRFLDYMESELMPYIDKNYQSSQYKVIAGHSIAGLFVVHGFHSRPDLFQAHLAFSPAVWWGARETVSAAQQYIIKGASVGSFLYMNIGAEGGEMRQVYDAFTQTILRNRSSDLILKLDVFANESHDFTLAAGLYNSLKALHKYQQHKGI
ncbi:alpha/beta hydrolase [Paraglaciecola sp. 2405UD69-4]|uniref:alpha/beta hydrolase n=1 Tax=Paraglaciecola sp. 2405UD69-4 TaxID=3391836 RepID=UPI0039C97D5B